MNKTTFQAATLIVGTLATGVAVSIDNTANVTDTRDRVVTSANGECVRTGSWTPALAHPTCNPKATPKVAAVVSAPEPVAAAPIVPAAPPAAAEKIILTEDTMFDFDKAVIKPAGKEALDGLVNKLQGNLRLVVSTGHTDATGRPGYNQELSERRAEAVKAYLVAKGIDSSRIEAAGKGEREPIGNNATAAGRAQDRRVEIEVMKTAE